MFRFDDVIREVEENLTGQIDAAALARKMQLSVYEFRRIFAFLAGVSFGEYVRKRRLSLAALELQEEKKSVTEIALRYGYDSPSSFSRAFKEYHGMTPSEVKKGSSEFRLFSRISTTVVTSGGEDLVYRICHRDGFVLSGYAGISAMTDTECCEDVWNAFYDSEYAALLLNGSYSRIYAVYRDLGQEVECLIGVPDPVSGYPHRVEIPESEWVCFTLRGTEDARVNAFYGNILKQWLSSSGYERNRELPNIEIFPADMSEEIFDWEVWIPVIRGAEK